MQPVRPHGQVRPSLLTTMWPISPAPPRPSHSWPSSTTPPPTPVPQKTPRIERNGFAAPSSNSALVATFTSLESPTGAIRAASSFSASGYVPSQPGRLRALVTVPASSSTTPGEPTPTAVSSPGPTAACSAASRSAAIIASVTSAGPPSVGVAWLDEHRHEAPDSRGDDDAAVAARRAWQRRLAEARLAAVTWPAEYGGAGLGPLQQVVVNQEIGRAGVPGIFDIIGVGMLGPTLIAHGSEEQKQRYLGPMLTADEVWCQLFSEPAAGSDLAGIQTRARREEDGSWRLSGQKVWTTNAQHASFGLLLARTEPDVPKHKGLTMFVLPMQAPGVSVRPLRS